MDASETNEKKITGKAEIIEKFSKEVLKDVLFLEKECFPKEWLYEDAEEYYEEMLKDGNNINIFLKFGDKIGGYLLATPFKKAFESLKEYDFELKLDEDSDKTKIYLETIQILPDFRSMGGAENLITTMCEEGKKRGMKKFSIHARKSNGLNEKVKKIFSSKISESRDLKEWHYGGNEPYEYIEVLLN